MGDAVQIDRHLFHERLTHFVNHWKNDRRSGDAVFGGAPSFSLVLGKAEEAMGSHKNGAFQFWLLGYEFPATLMIFTPETVHIVTTKKKAVYLEPLKGGKVGIEIYVRGKDQEENAIIFDKCTDVIKKSGKKHGFVSGSFAVGPFVDEWQQSYEKIFKDIEEIDVAPAISAAALSVKDERELRLIRDSARASSGLMTKYLVEELSTIVDEERKVSHKDFAEKVNSKLDDARFFQNSIKLSKEFDPSQLDWAYFPSIQSGGNYDLKLQSESDASNINQGVIVAALGLRYSSYSSLIARSMLVEPNKSQESTYRALMAVHDAVLKEVRDGVPVKSVYEKGLSVLKSKKPDLEPNFVDNVGSGIGVEPSDSSLVINAKNTRHLKDGMTLTIKTGLSDIKDPDPRSKKSEKYSLLIADTVRVTTSQPVVFTKDAPYDDEFAFFFFEDEEEEEKEKQAAKAKGKKAEPKPSHVVGDKTLRTRLRGGERATNQDAEKEAARREHQKELHKKKQQDGLERFKADTGALNGVEEKKFKRFESYKRDNQFPSKVKDLVICVDERSQTFVLPIMGRPVPFHIHTFKNASRTDELGWAFLRINFLSPGQGVGRKEDQPFEDLNAHFVRSLTFRSKDEDRMNEINRQLAELKKASVRREQEKKEMEDVVEQDKLVEIRNRRPHKMEPVFVRPGLEGKRLAGGIDIQQNGLRYHHPGGQNVDILFTNVKHLFFQPCDHELIVIIHVHLINPIMVGKRKTKDVQFYREATEMAFDETGNRKRKHRYGDEEEFEAEQEERRRRAQLNREFKQFAERISDAGRAENLSVDIPFRELGFNGVPARSSVLVQPTTDCLVQLTEPPFLVITLSDIEVVHLERVQFGLKNFDMVLVLHDFQKPPIHINTIPVEALDGVKDWLDSVDIPFSEGPLNLNWTTIMKTVTSDPHSFFADGGWSFLSTDSDDEDGDGGESEEESAFEMSEEELAEMSEESSEDESEFDDNASAEDEGDASDDDEVGEDWDELEEKAKKKDKASGLDEDTKGKSRPKPAKKDASKRR